MNNLDKQYTALLQDILDNGVTKQDRTGTGTLSVFGRQIRHKMSEGFPLLTTKKMPFRLIATELLWFLRGDTNIKYLVDNNCHIWTGDAKKKYDESFKKYWTAGNNPPKFSPISDKEFEKRILENDEFAAKWGELGPVYGKQWRKWKNFKTIHVDQIDKAEGIYKIHSTEFTNIDQIANLINDLKTNPDSRRLMVSSWNVGELDQMTLPPCHYGFQVYTRELSIKERMEEYKRRNLTPNIDPLDMVPSRAISLMWNQRSVDTFLGLPFNIASYGLLLEIIAKEVNMVPDELIGNLGDTHLYLNHIEQAKEQIGEIIYEDSLTVYSPFHVDGITKKIPIGSTREPFPLPKLLCLDEYHYLTDEELVGVIPFTEKIKEFRPDFFTMGNYQSHATIKAPLSN